MKFLFLLLDIITDFSSPVGFRGMPTAGAYGMTKAAQLNLAESLYFDFKKLNIKISKDGRDEKQLKKDAKKYLNYMKKEFPKIEKKLLKY